MPSARIQRRIDSLLDQTEEAADREDWSLSVRRAREALALDDTNSDAAVLIGAAEAMLDGPPSSDVGRHVEASQSQPVPQPDAPSAFAGGRYEVREFLGKGGKKRVFLAHDSLLDREVAFALIRTEGLDDAGREPPASEAPVRREEQPVRQHLPRPVQPGEEIHMYDPPTDVRWAPKGGGGDRIPPRRGGRPYPD